jgi:hypothetical protein
MGRSHRLVGLLALGLVGLSSVAKAANVGSSGTDFWLMFTQNYQGSSALSFFIAGDTATTGTVSVPGIAFSTPFSVTPGNITTVNLPSNAETSVSGAVAATGIHVTSGAPVTVYGLNYIQYTTDAFLGLPTASLGTDYVVMAFPNTNIVNGTEFGVAATQDSTVVTITPTVTTSGHAAGVPFNVTLNAGQVYQLQNADAAPADLTGSIVTATAPVAVFGGQDCANIPNGNYYACNYVVEQLPPTAAWGSKFVTEPLATRLNGDYFRILAGTNGTVVSLNGAVVATLNRGQVYSQEIAGSSVITATQPVLVAQYSNSSTYDGTSSDPFMMIVPPYEQFLLSYTVTTPSTGFPSDYINVVVPSSATSNVLLDGAAVAPAKFSAIGSSGFSGGQLAVGIGTHNVTTTSGNVPFGIWVYGYFNYDGYGYVGGTGLAKIVNLASITLAPKTGSDPVGSSHCVTATLLNSDSTPGAGRVDFTVSGANTASGSVFADASGHAQFCYTGTSAGSDSIVASVGSLSDTAAETWTAVQTMTPPSCALTAVIAGPPKALQITVQSATAGIQSVVVTESNNSDVVVPAFSAGDKTPLVVVATKIDQSKGSNVGLSITDVNGLVTKCDPVVPAESSADTSAPASPSAGCSVASGGSSGLGVILVGLFLGMVVVRRRRAGR